MKKFVLLFLLLAILDEAIPQSTFKYEFQTPPSPNAASLGVFGEIQVDYYSGLPNITVPLLEFSQYGLSFKLFLSYNFGGVRVDEEGSWVGSNWTFNCSGVITRVMKDRADELTNFGVCTDGDPDMFYFNFFGRSGKFILDPVNQNIILINKDAISISKKDQNNFLEGFLITLGDGTKYHFDVKEYQEITEGTSLSTFTTTTTYITSWYLSKIETTLGDVITFEYSPEYPAKHSYKSYTDFYSLSINPAIIEWPSGGTSTPNCYTDGELGLNGDPKLPDLVINTSTINYRNKYLKKINFGIGSIEFLTTNRDDFLHETALSYGQKLEEIILKNAGGNPIKRIGFEYSYLNALANNGALSKRLALTKCKSLALGSNSEIQSYKFSYNTTALPDKNSLDHDRWGFYNGPKNNPILPRQRNNQPDESYCKAGILEKIIYPTGGYTVFEAGINEYVDRTNVNITYQGGGLRINKITNYSEQNIIASVKRFEYKKVVNNQLVCSGKSIGVNRNRYRYYNLYLNSPFNYQHSVWRKNSSCNYLYNSNGTPKYELATIRYTSENEVTSSSNCFPLGEYSGNGNAVCYDKVIEYYDESGILGKTEYEYDNNYASPDLSNNYYPPANMPQIVPITNGQLRRVANFKREGTGYDLIAERIYTYASKSYQETLAKRKTSLGNNAPTCGFQIDYKIFSDWRVVNTETVNELSTGNETISQIMTYDYGNSLHKQLTTKQKFNSLGESEQEYFKYPSDFALPNNVYQTMINKNIIIPVVEYQKTITKNGIENPVVKSKIEYDNFFSVLQLPKSEYFQIKTNSLEERIRYDYSNNGRLIEQNKINDAKNSFIYDYHSTYPIAKVSNAAYNEIAHTSFEADGAGNWSGINNSNIVYDATSPTGRKCYRIPPTVHGALLTKGGLDGSKQYIVSYWSKTGAIPVYYCKQNPNFPTMQYIGFGAVLSHAGQNGWVYYEHVISNTSTINVGCNLDNGICGIQGEVGMTCGEQFFDELRLYPKNGLMASYTYDPLNGMTSQCDANNRITYYEYDGFGRLMHIRDQDKKIIKKFCYNYKGQQENCTINTTALWLSTGNYRCVLNGSAENTGYQEKEEADNNPLSATYLQTRWVDNGYNASACPPPYNCNPSNCYGDGFSCINGQCEQGFRVNTWSYYDYSMGQYVCVYHYEFSDGSWSTDYYEYSYWPCYLQ